MKETRQGDELIARARLQALKKCVFLPGSNHKRFVRQTDPAGKLTERQIAYIGILAYRYRRQMPDHLVPAQKPADLPPPPPQLKRAFKRAIKLQPQQKELL